MDNAMEASGVCRRYGEQDVLRDFALALPAGAFEALMGPSGSGKSTFLHIAAGLVSADSGSVLVGGEDVVRMRDAEAARFRRRHVGVVFQSFNLLAEKSVAENILMPLVLDGRARGGKARERLASLAERLGLAALLDRSPGALSGGERQRVAIARALVAEPDVVLADEPTGNLDAKAARETCALLSEVSADEKSAILLVTHDPVVAASASKVHFLKDGRIAASHETAGDPALVSRLYLECFG